MSKLTKLAIVLWTLTSSCEDVSETEPAEYYPISGNSLEYKVIRNDYSIANTVPTVSTYYIREMIGDSIAEIEGYPLYSLRRYTKNAIPESWQVDSVWTIYRMPDKIVRIENNTSYLIMPLPLTDGQTWDRNKLNTLVPAFFYAENSSPSILKIIQRGDSSLIHHRSGYETYKNHVGLIYKEVKNYQYCQTTPECIGKNIISSGFDIVYECINCD